MGKSKAMSKCVCGYIYPSACPKCKPPTSEPSEPPSEPGDYDLTIRVRVDQSGDKDFGMLLVEFPQSVSYVDVLDIKGQWQGPFEAPK